MDSMIYLNGPDKPSFRCDCGCNVFTKLPDNPATGERRFECNSCGATWAGEDKDRPAPTTPEVGLLEKKAAWIEKRLKGKRVRMGWKFAGSENVHEGVCEGIVECHKGKSVMLTLPERGRVSYAIIGYEDTHEDRGGKRFPIKKAIWGDKVVGRTRPPLYVPLRAVTSIEAIP